MITVKELTNGKVTEYTDEDATTENGAALGLVIPRNPIFFAVLETKSKVQNKLCIYSYRVSNSITGLLHVLYSDWMQLCNTAHSRKLKGLLNEYILGGHCSRITSTMSMIKPDAPIYMISKTRDSLLKRYIGGALINYVSYESVIQVNVVVKDKNDDNNNQVIHLCPNILHSFLPVTYNRREWNVYMDKDELTKRVMSGLENDLSKLRKQVVKKKS